jgi:hypothetical protein
MCTGSACHIALAPIGRPSRIVDIVPLRMKWREGEKEGWRIGSGEVVLNSICSSFRLPNSGCAVWFSVRVK